MVKAEIGLKIAALVAKGLDGDGLTGEKVDKIPISPEVDYVLNEIAKEHGLATRAKTWRWLLANYVKSEWAERYCKAIKQEESVRLGLESLLAEIPG
jgi:hypothetical protein